MGTRGNIPVAMISRHDLVIASETKSWSGPARESDVELTARFQPCLPFSPRHPQHHPFVPDQLLTTSLTHAPTSYGQAQEGARGRGRSRWDDLRRAALSPPGSVRGHRDRDPGLLWRTGLLDPDRQGKVRRRLDEPGQSNDAAM
jgi:hypothetical protein